MNYFWNQVVEGIFWITFKSSTRITSIECSQQACSVANCFHIIWKVLCKAEFVFFFFVCGKHQQGWNKTQSDTTTSKLQLLYKSQMERMSSGLRRCCSPWRWRRTETGRRAPGWCRGPAGTRAGESAATRTAWTARRSPAGWRRRAAGRKHTSDWGLFSLVRTSSSEDHLWIKRRAKTCFAKLKLHFAALITLYLFIWQWWQTWVVFMLRCVCESVFSVPVRLAPV